MISRGTGYSVTIRAEYSNKEGMLGKIASSIGKAGGDIGAVDIVHMSRDRICRDITVGVRDEGHAHALVSHIKAMAGVKVIRVSDRILLMHLGGKIEVTPKVPVTDRATLSIVYTPGVAHVSTTIHQDPASVWNLTIKRNTVAVVSDGTAVLGLGDIGPEAAMPVMEGKAMIFKEFAGIDAWPLCLKTKDPDEIVRVVRAVSPGFGGINLEDISAPHCFEVEERLRQELDIPVFHDDQHGTAVVVLAGLLNALKIVNKALPDTKIVISGAGAAASACAQLFLSQGVKDIILCDRAGALYQGRKENMNPYKVKLAQATNPTQFTGSLVDALEGADIFLGVSAPGLLKGPDLRKMNRDPIVFALANPTPEIMPEDAIQYARVVATGRSDYPNQVNNSLCFPGIFRGALDVRAREINDEMKLAAARAIASMVTKRELGEEYIIPSMFNRGVARAVARDVIEAARKSGVARRSRRDHHMQ